MSWVYKIINQHPRRCIAEGFKKRTTAALFSISLSISYWLCNWTWDAALTVTQTWYRLPLVYICLYASDVYIIVIGLLLVGRRYTDRIAKFKETFLFLLLCFTPPPHFSSNKSVLGKFLRLMILFLDHQWLEICWSWE